MENKKKKRLVIDINEDTHKLIKMRAHRKNIHLTDYILQAIAQRMVREDIEAKKYENCEN